MLNRFAQLGLALEVTELDVTLPDEQTQADYLRDFMTVAFSHPAVNGIVLWGFWEGQHWRPPAALFRLNWEQKPNGIQWSNLVFHTWWTTTNAPTDAGGSATVRGFKGDYQLAVTTPGTNWQTQLTLTNDVTLRVVVPATAPKLTVTSTGSAVELGWPTTAVSYHLERTPQLSPTTWQYYTATPGVTGTNYVVTLPAESPGFYRLARIPAP
jgi:hypothetical protein